MMEIKSKINNLDLLKVSRGYNYLLMRKLWIMAIINNLVGLIVHILKEGHYLGQY